MSAQFAIRALHVLSYAGGFTHWLYRVPADTRAAPLAPGFFDPAADMLAGGDCITVSGADGGMILWVQSATEAGGVVVKVMART